MCNPLLSSSPPDGGFYRRDSAQTLHARAFPGVPWGTIDFLRTPIRILNWIEPPMPSSVEGIFLGMELGQMLWSAMADSVLDGKSWCVTQKVRNVSPLHFASRITVDCLAGRIVNPVLPYSAYKPLLENMQSPTCPRSKRGAPQPGTDDAADDGNEPKPKSPRLRNGDGREGKSTAAPVFPKPTAPSRTVSLPSHTVGGPTALHTPMDTDADDAGAMFMLLLIAFASLVWVMIFSIFTAYYCALWRYNAQFPPSLLRINARYGAIMHNWCCV